jgi:hypothetical protein
MPWFCGPVPLCPHRRWGSTPLAEITSHCRSPFASASSIAWCRAPSIGRGVLTHIRIKRAAPFSDLQPLIAHPNGHVAEPLIISTSTSPIPGARTCHRKGRSLAALVMNSRQPGARKPLQNTSVPGSMPEFEGGRGWMGVSANAGYYRGSVELRKAWRYPGDPSIPDSVCQRFAGNTALCGRPRIPCPRVVPATDFPHRQRDADEPEWWTDRPPTIPPPDTRADDRSPHPPAPIPAPVYAPPHRPPGGPAGQEDPVR